MKGELVMQKKINLNDFYFIKKEIEFSEFNKIDNSDLLKVKVPHDHAISSSFNPKNDLQVTRIIEDGEKKDEQHQGRTGGLDHVGVAYYRKKLAYTELTDNKKIFIYFGAVMSQGEIFINGHKVGERPYGYSSFYLSIENYLNYDGKDELVVKINNLPESSRWYPGAGIIRPVHILISDKVYFTPWENKLEYILYQDSANIEISCLLSNDYDTEKKYTLVHNLKNKQGDIVAKVESEGSLAPNDVIKTNNKVSLEKINKWCLEDPYLYTLHSQILIDGKIVAESSLKTGFREIEFTANNGFLLNGTRVNFKGVCLHHDQGPLGAISNISSYRRQLTLLKEMGCNAIRTTHNPAAEEFIQLCDEMGFLVIEEAFDEWAHPKCKNGYNLHFEKWSERDLRDMIKRDRHSPSIILWSIGNEIPEQGLPKGAEVGQRLTDICHDEDPTRLVTAGFNNPTQAINNGMVDAIDVLGVNYKPFWYGKFKHQRPDWIIYGSETSSTVSSRGEYSFPIGDEKNFKQANLQVSSYDFSSAPWATSPDQEFQAQEENPFVLGEFIWTGFDYLGEPTPYGTDWPSRSSYFGAIDLCGIPKDRFYLYKSQWSNDKVLHISPHWNWEGREGEETPIQVYTNYAKVEIFVNGVSKGKKSKTLRSLFERYRLTWKNIPYEKGQIKAVAYDNKGVVLEEKTIETAGEVSQIKLIPNRKSIVSSLDNLLFVEFNLLDEKGNLCPLASNEVYFETNSKLEIVGVGNGDATSLEPFVASKRMAFHGKGMVILKGLIQGEGLLKVKSNGLETSVLTIPLSLKEN